MIRKVKRLLPLVMSLLFFNACESQPDVPLVVAEVVPTTTTTTVKAPVMIVSQTPAATTTTTLAPPPKPILPSISEPEYRNLFASVNESYKEAIFYEIEGLLPEAFVSASALFRDARANFDTQVWRWPYDGEAAYPFAQELRAAGRSLEALLAKGLPLRSEAEKAKVKTLADTASASGLPQAVPDRHSKARAEFELGNVLHGKAQYRLSIAAFRKAKLLFASAEALAAVETQKTKLEDSGFAKYSPYDIIEAVRLLAEDERLYALDEDEAVSRGIELLGKARQYYANAYTWGLECGAAEARDKALLAKRWADSLLAKDNAAEGYENASAFLGRGDEKRGISDFAGAADQYRQAESSFDESYRLSERSRCEAKSAQELAKRGAEYLRAEFIAAEINPDTNFGEAELFIGLADKALEEYSFAIAKTDYIEALNQLNVSRSILRAEIDNRHGIARAEADRLAEEKAAAEEAAAMALAAKNAEMEALRAEKAEAELRLAEALSSRETEARAEADRLAAERAALEKAASEAKAEADRLAAETRAESERLVAKRAAEEQAARDKAAAEAAARAAQAAARAAADQAQQREAARAAALSALDQAQARYDWATKANAELNYPEEYESGASQIRQARRAYDAADYQLALSQAQSALVAMEGIAEFAPFPAGYIVDLLPERRNIDSLTSIAALGYIYNDPLKWGLLYEANKTQLRDPGNPDLLLSGQVIMIPSLRGEARSGIWDPKKSYGTLEKGYISEEEKQALESALKTGLAARAKTLANAKDALDEAQKAYEKALNKNAKNNYPDALTEAQKTFDLAKASFKSGNYSSASSQARIAAETFASIPEFATLPALYKVRYIPGETDTLWRISGYTFVYNDNSLWMRIYDANKDLSHASEDPHLILPGQILTIPSLKGEKREGLWDSKKTYPPYK